MPPVNTLSAYLCSRRRAITSYWEGRVMGIPIVDILSRFARSRLDAVWSSGHTDSFNSVIRVVLPDSVSIPVPLFTNI